MKTVYLFFICIVIFSCGRNQEKDNISEIKLISESLNIEDSVFMKYPYRLNIVDTTLIVWDLHSIENYFHAFSFPQLKYLYSFGKVGNGPEEFTSCGGIVFDQDQIYIFETNKAILYQYSLNLLNHNVLRANKIVQYPRECIPLTKFTALGTEGFVTIDNSGQGRLLFLNNDGEIVKKESKIPCTIESLNIPEPMKAVLWSSTLDYNSNNKTLVLASNLGEVLEIYDLKNNTSKVVIGEGGEPDVLRSGGGISLGKIEGYSDVFVGDKEIYAIYSGQNIREISKLEKEGNRMPNGGNKIYVYDLAGNLLRKYLLDRYINGFYIDFSRNEIYAVDSNSDNQLCRFTMN